MVSVYSTLLQLDCRLPLENDSNPELIRAIITYHDHDFEGSRKHCNTLHGLAITRRAS